MDYGRAAEILGRRKWLIVFSVLVTVVLTWGATRLTGARWTTTVRLIAPSQSPLTDAPNSRSSEAGAMDARSQATMYATVAKSHDVVDNAIKKSKIAIPPLALAGGIDFEAAGARMFELKISDSSPSRSEMLANAVADSFVEEVHDLTTQQAQKVVSLLEAQQHEEDGKLASIRARYDAYSASHGVLGSPASQLALIFKRLELARQGRDEAEARLADAQARWNGKRVQLAQTPALVQTERSSDMRPLVRQLEEQLARKETDLIDLRAKYTESDPKVRAASEIRNALQARLKQEKNVSDVNRQPNPIVAPLQQALAEAQQDIGSQQAVIAAQNKSILQAEAEIRQLRGLDSPLSILTSEITAGTEARQSLATRLNSARAALDVAEQGNPLVVLEKGGPSNPPQNMSSGRTKKLVMLAALCALIVTCGLVIAADSMDRRLKSVQEAEMVLPARVLAAIPPPDDEVTLRSLPRATQWHPLSQHAEAYHFLAQHVLSLHRQHIRTLMSLAARPGQGSTNTISNLGITLAQSGHRVILVDANTRNPRLHEIFEIPNDFGLTNVLENLDIFIVRQALYATSVPNLQVMPSGPASENPWELFSSQRLQAMVKYLLERADYVLFDTPSATAFADTMNLASVADAALLCVRALEPLTGEEARLVERFEQAGVQVLGSVLSHVPTTILESYRNGPRPLPQRFAPVPLAAENFTENRAIFTENMNTAQSVTADAPNEQAHSLFEEQPEQEEKPTDSRTDESEIARVPPDKQAALPQEEEIPAPQEPQVFAAPEESEPETQEQSFSEEPQNPVVQEETILVSQEPQALAALEEIIPVPREAEIAPEKQVFAPQDIVEPIAPDSESFDALIEISTTEEEFEMTMPTAEFPRATSGYAPGAVDEYARHMSARFEMMQRQTEQQASRAARYAADAERLTEELEEARRALSGLLEKEASVAGTALQTEQRRVQTEQELEAARIEARAEAERVLTQARREAASLLEEARRSAQESNARVAAYVSQSEQMLQAAKREAEAQKRQAREAEQQLEELNNEMEMERAQAKAEAAHLEAAALQQVEEAEAYTASARAEAERLAEQARNEAATILEDARRHAEEISMYAAAAHAAHEERLQSLSVECDEIVIRTRRALEAQIALLPMPASSDNGSSLLRNIFPSTSEAERSTRTEDVHALHAGEWPAAANGNTPRTVS